MIVTLHRIESLSYEKVAYYTVSIGDRNMEFVDFLERMNNIPKYKKQLSRILFHIKEIGEKYGAHESHFKCEESAEALPPPKEKFIDCDIGGFGLRLYCIRLTKSIVILLNGDFKTAQKVDLCENCKKHFQLAKTISNKINNAIRDRYLSLEGFEILIEDDFELEI